MVEQNSAPRNLRWNEPHGSTLREYFFSCERKIKIVARTKTMIWRALTDDLSSGIHKCQRILIWVSSTISLSPSFQLSVLDSVWCELGIHVIYFIIRLLSVLNTIFMLFEVGTLITILASVLVINLSLISVVWRTYKDKISSILTQKPSLEALDLNYQLKDHTPRIWSKSQRIVYISPGGVDCHLPTYPILCA